MKKIESLPIPYRGFDLELNGVHFIADINKLSITLKNFEKYKQTGIFNGEIEICFRDSEKIDKFKKEYKNIDLDHYKNLKLSLDTQKYLFFVTPVKESDGALFGKLNIETGVSVGYIKINSLVDTKYGFLIVTGDSIVEIDYVQEEVFVDYILKNQISCKNMKKKFKLNELKEF